MNVHSKLNVFTDELTNEIMKHPDPSKVRIIRLTSDGIVVFKNTTKAAEFLRNMILELEGWTVTMESMIGILNDDKGLSESKKMHMLNNVMNIEIIR